MPWNRVQDRPAARARAGGRTWTSLSLGVLALLIMTVRFPPDDLTGWIGQALGVPIWVVLASCAVLSAVGFLLVPAGRGSALDVGARWLTAIAFLLALYGSVSAA